VVTGHGLQGKRGQVKEYERVRAFQNPRQLVWERVLFTEHLTTGWEIRARYLI